jgi:hypothetical protein
VEKMFHEGDLINVTNLSQEVEEILEDALEADFEDIDFYFVEYHDDDYAVLTAETEKKFAIVHCPLNAMEGYYNDEDEVEALLHHVITNHLVDYALDTRNEELFHAIMEYKENSESPRKEPVEENIYMDMLVDIDSEEFLDELDDIFGDED